MKVNCVILNYNDAQTVEELVAQIRDYACIDRIVLVDNASADGSFQRLRALAGDRVDVIRAEKNGGYGAGNNLGIRYAVEQNGATHVLVANPDVSFDEGCIRGLARVFRRHPEVGVAAASMEDRQYGSSLNGWRLYGFTGLLLSMGPVSRRVFCCFLSCHRPRSDGKKAIYVDVVHGSMLMVDGAAFLECGGYDEGIFLYQEEMVLASRMKALGRRTVLLLGESYRHGHSVSVSKAYSQELARQRIREESTLYYMKNYLHIRPFQEWAARLWFWGIRMEVRVFRTIFGGIKGHGSSK